MNVCQKLCEHGGTTAYPEATPESSVRWNTKARSDTSCEYPNINVLHNVEHLNSIFNNLPVAVITLNEHGYVSFCNEVAIQFFDFQLIGKLWRTIIERCFIQGEDNDELVLNDGRIVRLDTSPLDDKCGQVLVFSDITKDRDIKNIRDHYSRLSDLGEMAATLAHQIRTPLAASMLFFSNIKKSLESDSSSKSFDKGMSGLRHIETLIKDMLIFSSGNKINNEEVMISDLVDDLNQDVIVLIKEYECEIKINDKTSGASIYGNRHALRAAISNLIVNSAQACNKKSGIDSVEPRENKSYKARVNVYITEEFFDKETKSINVLVKDNGIGICSNKINSIKEPFYTTKTDGTGLGLAVTRSVIENHGGSIKVDSTVMIGTSIDLMIPKIAL